MSRLNPERHNGAWAAALLALLWLTAAIVGARYQPEGAEGALYFLAEALGLALVPWALGAWAGWNAPWRRIPAASIAFIATGMFAILT